MTQILRRPPLPLLRTFQAPRAHRVVAGPGAIATLGAELERLGAMRALVLTGRSVGQGTPLVARLHDAAPGRIAGTFDGISAHTPLEDVAAALVLAGKLEADAVVSLGGGAVMDAGKYVTLCHALDLRTPAAIRAHLAAQTADPMPIPAMPAQVAIPTTASAAEFTQVAGVLDRAAGSKRRLDHPQIVPDVILQDPEAVLFTPPDLWLSSAIRSLDHAVEGLYGPRATPYTDGLGKEAIRLLARGLPAYRADPRDLAAIADVQAATWLSATCGNNAQTGLSHGIGYLMGAGFGVPHGHCSCISLQHVVAWMAPAAAPHLAEVARALGAAGPGMPEAEAADAAGPAIGALVKAIGQPTQARDAGVPSRAELLALAPKVLRLPHVAGSPRQPRDLAEAEALLDRMW